jgi:type VI secretion system secreted protein VgrG
MSMYSQADRPMTVTTPLGKDDLLPVGFSGREAISQLFRFQLNALAENKTHIEFDKLLGRKITIHLHLPGGKQRHVSGICKSVCQGGRDNQFTSYSLEIVPELWLLTKNRQSRIFQQLSVPDILKKALQGLNVSYEIQGTFPLRDYCAQYRETDFDFASRLMEEEGIYYFFKHNPDGHTLVLGNTPQSHPDIPEAGHLVYGESAGGLQEEDRIQSWEKSQELRSGKCTLWDYCFELPGKNLASENTILESVQIGSVAHSLKTGGNDKLEIYDYPGSYAKRFDGVDPRGGDKSGDLQKVFDDGIRTVGIRMQEEETAGIVITGKSECRKLVSGHKFELEKHFNANGQYLIASVEHFAEFSGGFQSGMSKFQYHNSFTCIPYALPFRPPQITSKPLVRGTQTAVVVGPSGEEIFTDKYGRVKVQFRWDREGKSNNDSSCWIRVATPLAGRQWGIYHVPRIGQEVVISFEEGDPDQPIVIGSVFNAEMMPPYKLPGDKTKVGYKSSSSPGGGGFNELRFEDKKGEEQVFLQGEKDFEVHIKNDATEWIGKDRTVTVVGKSDQSAKSYHLKAESVVIEADISLTLKVGQSVIKLDATGIKISAAGTVGIDAQALAEIKGTLVKIN